MKIAIIGIGSMGSWLAKELLKENEVAVYNRNIKKAALIEQAKVLTDISELQDFGPDILINAVSLTLTEEIFEKAIPHIPEECVLCDIMSIKMNIPKFYAKTGHKYISLHPMFGPTFANMNELKNESVVLIKGSDPEASEFFKNFFSKLGLNIFEYTFQEHEEMMAYSLTTPFAATLVFAACVDNTVVPGTTFAKHRVIAEGLLSEDDHLLAEVLFNERSLNQLEKITGRLEFVKHIIKAKDFEEAKRFFDKLRENLENGNPT